MEIEVRPLDGIYWDDKYIKIRDTKETVRKAIEDFRDQVESYFCFNDELRIDFDENDHVEFIEFLAGIEGNIQPVIYGVRAFSVLSYDLYTTLYSHNNGAIGDSENGYCFSFLNISVGVYRERKPEDFTAMVKELEQNGVNIQNSVEMEKERVKSLHWDTLGIGSKDYYR